jgi:hypothetical protein
MDQAHGDAFLKRRKKILEEFVDHFKDDIDREIVLEAVNQAEEAFVASHIDSIVAAEEGTLETRWRVGMSNILNVVVVLQEVPPERFKHIAELKVDPAKVYIFEIEGKHFLPDGDTATS